MTLDAMIERAIYRNFRQAKGKPLADQARFREDLEGNDLDLLQCVMDIEDALDTDVDDAEAEALRTVGDLRRLVAIKMGVSADG